MGYCRNCGNRLEDNMTFCPKCGTPVTAVPQRNYSSERHTDRSITFLVIGLVGAIVIVAAVILSLIALGLLPGMPFPVGSGNVQTRDFNLTDFTAIQVSSGFNLQLTQAENYSIKITADDNIFNYILVNQTGNTLSIRLKSGIGFHTTALKAEVSMPDIQNIQLSGGVIGNAPSFNLTHDLTVDASGGSRLTMVGQANNLTAIASGGSNINLPDFKVYNAKIDFSGGSQGAIDVDGRLDATLSGGSHLNYKGNPTLGTIDTSGGSSISKVGQSSSNSGWRQ